MRGLAPAYSLSLLKEVIWCFRNDLVRDQAQYPTAHTSMHTLIQPLNFPTFFLKVEVYKAIIMQFENGNGLYKLTILFLVKTVCCIASDYQKTRRTPWQNVPEWNLTSVNKGISKNSAKQVKANGQFSSDSLKISQKLKIFRIFQKADDCTVYVA